MAKILIIEDEADQAELYRLALEGAGLEVVATADDFDVRKASAPAPDVVILDERLGRRSGVALIPRIRSAYPKARIMMLTADPEVAETAVQKGADEGRMKPMPLVKLVASVKGLLASSG